MTSSERNPDVDPSARDSSDINWGDVDSASSSVESGEIPTPIGEPGKAERTQTSQGVPENNQDLLEDHEPQEQGVNRPGPNIPHREIEKETANSSLYYEDRGGSSSKSGWQKSSERHYSNGSQPGSSYLDLDRVPSQQEDRRMNLGQNQNVPPPSWLNKQHKGGGGKKRKKKKNTDSSLRHCDLCNVNCTGLPAWESHIRGKKHQTADRQGKWRSSYQGINNPLTSAAKIEVRSPQYSASDKGSGHGVLASAAPPDSVRAAQGPSRSHALDVGRYGGKSSKEPAENKSSIRSPFVNNKAANYDDHASGSASEKITSPRSPVLDDVAASYDGGTSGTASVAPSSNMDNQQFQERRDSSEKMLSVRSPVVHDEAPRHGGQTTGSASERITSPLFPVFDDGASRTASAAPSLDHGHQQFQERNLSVTADPGARPPILSPQVSNGFLPGASADWEVSSPLREDRRESAIANRRRSPSRFSTAKNNRDGEDKGVVGSDSSKEGQDRMEDVSPTAFDNTLVEKLTLFGGTSLGEKGESSGKAPKEVVASNAILAKEDSGEVRGVMGTQAPIPQGCEGASTKAILSSVPGEEAAVCGNLALKPIAVSGSVLDERIEMSDDWAANKIPALDSVKPGGQMLVQSSSPSNMLGVTHPIEPKQKPKQISAIEAQVKLAERSKNGSFQLEVVQKAREADLQKKGTGKTPFAQDRSFASPFVRTSSKKQQEPENYAVSKQPAVDGKCDGETTTPSRLSPASFVPRPRLRSQPAPFDPSVGRALGNPFRSNNGATNNGLPSEQRASGGERLFEMGAPNSHQRNERLKRGSRFQSPGQIRGLNRGNGNEAHWNTARGGTKGSPGSSATVKDVLRRGLPPVPSSAEDLKHLPKVPMQWADGIMSMAEWRELRQHTFNHGTDVDKLAYKVLQETLLSPAVGTDTAMLEPFSNAMGKAVQDMYYTPQGVYARTSDLPDALKNGDPKYNSEKKEDADWSQKQTAEHIAMCNINDNLEFTFNHERVDPPPGKLDMNDFPPRGSYGTKGNRKGPGIVNDGERAPRYPDSVAEDELFKSLMAHQMWKQQQLGGDPQEKRVFGDK